LKEDAGFFTGPKQFFHAQAQSGVAGAGVNKKSSALSGWQPPRRAEDGYFAIRGINHAKNSFSALQSEKPEQKAQTVLTMSLPKENALISWQFAKRSGSVEQIASCSLTVVSP
jgi:hypothetical protein